MKKIDYLSSIRRLKRAEKELDKVEMLLEKVSSHLEAETRGYKAA